MFLKSNLNNFITKQKIKGIKYNESIYMYICIYKKKKIINALILFENKKRNKNCLQVLHTIFDMLIVRKELGKEK